MMMMIYDLKEVNCSLFHVCVTDDACSLLKVTR